MQSVFKFSYTIALIVLGAAGSLEAQVTARVGVIPETVMAGTRAQYMIIFNNTTSLPNINTPRVEGLEFSDGMGTSSLQQTINGRATVETRATWTFRATREGTFTIPGRTLRISGEDVTVSPVTFQVVPMDEETRNRIFMRAEIPDGPYFVGEAIPIRVGLFVRNDIGRANYGRPDRIGEAFINTPIDNDPVRSSARVEGRIYEVLVWDTVLTPIKTGQAELAFQQPVQVRVSEEDNRFPSIFNLSRSRTESYTLTTDTLMTTVLPLPEEDRPESFRDAIGDFTVTAELSSRDLQVGEPITLTLAIEGTGNFDRISPPEIPEWEGWRVYPPKVEFTPNDGTGLSGRKTFEYILIPQEVSITEIPEIGYATFNPETETYSTTILEAEPVTVQPPASPVDSGPVFNASAPQETERDPVPDALLPIRPEAGRLFTHAGAPWKDVRFWILNGFAGLALLLIARWLRQRRRLRDDVILARRHAGGRKVRKALQTAREAAKSGNQQSFFEAARYALQELISHLDPSPTEARTLVTSDCLAILESSGVSESLRERCMTILNAADAAQFAGIQPQADKLLQMSDELVSITTDLNRILK
jgi:hypothetical protein